MYTLARTHPPGHMHECAFFPSGCALDPGACIGQWYASGSK